LQTSFVQLPNYFKGIGEVEKQLDETNIKILTAMATYGPRNLLEISRRTGIPFTSVYHRVAKLEEKSGRIVYLLPDTSKFGMVKVIVLLGANPGSETLVTEALKLPKLWRVINPCEGTFTHESSHAVPVQMLAEFKAYIETLGEIGIAQNIKIFLAADSVPVFPNFGYYNPTAKQWAFPWGQWLNSMKTDFTATVQEPPDYTNHADKKDLLIISKLEDNARFTYSELKPFLQTSLQAIKYHWDKRLIPNDMLKHYAFDVYPYPLEICSYHDVMLEFSSSHSMNQFATILPELFWVMASAKILKSNTLLVRTYIPTIQLPNMFTFFSEMAKQGMLTSYSAIRLSFAGREVQSVPCELFDDEKGWAVNLQQCRAELVALATSKPVTDNIR
jgi:DNA-binding Lrp family transcriptional regulator